MAGNLEEVAELIDSSPYVKRYTAGCLSFLEDDLSDTKKKNLMAAFEKTLFPGLAPEQYRIVWIEHRDKEYIEKKNEETGKEKKQRRLELNFLIPNVEITTGKRLQPFYAKADLNRVDDFKSIVNHKYQLFDPDDPINRRSVKIAKNLPQDKKDFISAMNTEVALAITEGLVSDRESLKAWMTDIGLEITRITKNQISVKNPNNPDSKAIPLKGEFYEQNFRHSEKSAELKREASERYRREANSRYADCIERYQKLCKSKSEYHLERYATRDRTDSAELTRQFTEQENEHTSEYKYNGENLNKDTQAMQESLQMQIQSMKKDLQTLNGLSQATAEQAKLKKPFFIEYNSSFDSTYFAYHEHQLRIYQQQQIQRHQSDGSESNLSEAEWGKHEYTEVWRLENSEIMRTSRPDSPSIQQQLRSGAGDELNELRSTIIEDYRRSTASIEATTASTIRSSTAYTGTISDHRRIEAVHENFKRQTPRSSQDSAEISANNARIIRANYLSNIFTNCARELEGTITDTFRQFSREFTDRWTSETSYKEHSAEPNQDRNREANSTIGGTVERENGLSTAISRKVRGFDTENIFKALDLLDKRKELQKNNDRRYDSPRPF